MPCVRSDRRGTLKNIASGLLVVCDVSEHVILKSHWRDSGAPVLVELCYRFETLSSRFISRFEPLEHRQTYRNIHKEIDPEEPALDILRGNEVPRTRNALNRSRLKHGESIVCPPKTPSFIGWVLTMSLRYRAQLLKSSLHTSYR